MATYCISDIHGHPDNLLALLDKISPASDDAVHILGDVVDRGPGTVRMLEWAMNKAPEGVRFLLGNHEDMLASYLRCRAESESSFGLDRMFSHYDHPYSWNTDLSTMRSVYGKKRRTWWENEVLPWIDGLPLYAIAEAGGQRWMLVHAGFNPMRWENPGSLPNTIFEEGLRERGAREGNVDLSEHSFGIQWAQTLLWARDGWLNWPNDAPLPVVCGHTPTQNDWVQQCVENIEGASGGPGRICHIRNRHVIDCGCGYHSRFRATWNLAALRLDDLEEFYLR